MVGRWSFPWRVLIPSIGAGITRSLRPKEDVMYLSVGVVFAIILVLTSPIVWVVWWLLADLGEKATGSYSTVHHATAGEPHRRAA